MAHASKLSALLADACGRGDPAAQERAFEEVFRLLSIFVRSSMGDALRRHRESVDVCQTVARSLIVDLREGKVSFPNEAAMVGYLQTVVRTKLAELSRRDRALKRGGDQHEVRISTDDDQAADWDPSASMHVIGREAFDRILSSLSESEQELVRLRQGGLSWQQISERTGRTSAALRKEWSRLQSRFADCS